MKASKIIAALAETMAAQPQPIDPERQATWSQVKKAMNIQDRATIEAILLREGYRKVKVRNLRTNRIIEAWEKADGS